MIAVFREIRLYMVPVLSCSGKSIFPLLSLYCCCCCRLFFLKVLRKNKNSLEKVENRLNINLVVLVWKKKCLFSLCVAIASFLTFT
jgi:hypothetical protein